MLSTTTEEKRNVNVNMKQHPNQRLVVGSIYHDKSDSSLWY